MAEKGLIKIHDRSDETGTKIDFGIRKENRRTPKGKAWGVDFTAMIEIQDAHIGIVHGENIRVLDLSLDAALGGYGGISHVHGEGKFDGLQAGIIRRGKIVETMLKADGEVNWYSTSGADITLSALAQVDFRTLETPKFALPWVTLAAGTNFFAGIGGAVMEGKMREAAVQTKFAVASGKSEEGGIERVHAFSAGIQADPQIGIDIGLLRIKEHQLLTARILPKGELHLALGTATVHGEDLTEIKLSAPGVFAQSPVPKEED